MDVVRSLTLAYAKRLFPDSLCEGMGVGCCTQPYPCICKEAVSGFEPMTNKSPRHNLTAAPGLALFVKYSHLIKISRPKILKVETEVTKTER